MILHDKATLYLRMLDVKFCVAMVKSTTAATLRLNFALVRSSVLNMRRSVVVDVRVVSSIAVPQHSMPAIEGENLG